MDPDVAFYFCIPTVIAKLEKKISPGDSQSETEPNRKNPVDFDLNI
jgi:hypothetical protein